MATGRQIQKKGPSSATPTSAKGMFKPRPFGMPPEPEAANAPELQTKAEPGQVTGSRLSRIDVSTPPPIQPKLAIGAPDDKYEQEADTIARKVVKQISTSTPPNPNGGGGSVQRQMFSTPSIMRLTVQRWEAVEGGAASSDLESTISQARSSGKPLGEPIRRQMEGAFGADFSSIRVHTNNTADTLNRSLSARAFTTGNNIFFKQGEYNPSSSSGKELLAHELTHTIQQGSSPTVQRQSNTPLISAAHQSLQTSTFLVQRKGMVLSAKTRLHKIVDGKDKGTVGANIAPGTLVEISDNDSDHIQVDGKIEWYRNAQGDGYIRATKIFQGITVGNAENPENEVDLLGGFNDSAISVSKDSLDSFSKEMEKKETSTTDVDISSGSLGTAGGLLGMALSIKGFVGSKKELGDWVDMIWNGIIVNSGKATAGISGIISSASESGSTGATKAKEASGWSGSFASAFETLGGAVKTIKSVIDLIKMWSSDEKFGKPEYAKVGSEIISGALSTAKGVVDSIKSFIEIFNGPVGGLADAVPGLDIAINAVKMIMESYYLATSAYHWSKMRTASSDLIKGLEAGGKGDQTKISTAKKEYATQRAEITNLETRKSAKEAKNQSRQQAITQLSTEQTELENKKQILETERQQLEADKLNLEQQNTKLQAGKTPDQAGIKANQQAIKLHSSQINTKQKEIEVINDRLNGTLFRSGIIKEKAELQDKVNITAPKINDAATKIATKQGTMAAYATGTGLSQEDIEEVDLADELTSGNQKRIIRQSIHLSSDAVKIAGSIANLTGVGATAGVALKASAAGVDLSLPFLRSLKQYGRKKAAEGQAKGETGTFSQWLFNANKSDIAKLQERKRHTGTIFKMVNKLNAHIPLPGDLPADKASKLEQFRVSSARVELFIHATGCEPKALYRLNGKPNEQASLILKSLYKREF